MKTWLYLASLTVLAACSSTPTQHYQLPDSALLLPTQTAAQKVVSIKVVLSEPLNGSSLLYQSDANTLHIAQQNLWASPLHQSVATSLANKLNRQQSSLHFRSADLNHANPNTLTVYLDRFQGSYMGDTEINGYVQWHDQRMRPVRAVTPQQGNGYDAMLRSLDAGLNQIAAQIVMP
ncbi:membrane integrity-associated transporter subunit PqiC [Kingella kingae]|uniref:PqiC family protein n=1 Tax=Kingella kingae TaxID=504 RepID=UPI0004203CB5|nr:ABC-type transport auxiliary lipoprotein family protein [Kingella kingae]